jgi:molybdopterin-guanine dinucleotide biosynthesis protein A
VLGALGAGRAAAAAAEGTADLEPLCAAYRVECAVLVSAALDRGERAVHAVFRAAGGVVVPLPSAHFLNVNTRGDHARALAVLEDGAG